MFEFKTGPRPGNALYPVLFNLALEKAVRNIPDNKNMEIIGPY